MRGAGEATGATASGSTPPAAQSPTVRKQRATAQAASPPGPETSSQSAAPLPQYLCSKCQSLNLRILHGRYGYFFKCDDCAGNTWIDTRIDGTDRKGRIRKSGREFYLVDGERGQERLIFVNPE